MLRFSDSEMDGIVADPDGDYVWYSDHLAEIEKLNAAISVWKATHDLLKQEIAELRFDLTKPPQERTYCKGCSLPHLTAALNDNERAREIAGKDGSQKSSRRWDAIQDFRQWVLNEIGLLNSTITKEDMEHYTEDIGI